MRYLVFLFCIFLSTLTYSQSCDCFTFRNDSVQLYQTEKEIIFDHESHYCVINTIGSEVVHGYGSRIDISNLECGVYFIVMCGDFRKIYIR